MNQVQKLRERLDGIEQMNFDIDEMLRRLFSLLAMQTEITLENVKNGCLVMPEGLRQEGETNQ